VRHRRPHRAEKTSRVVFSLLILGALLVGCSASPGSPAATSQASATTSQASTTSSEAEGYDWKFGEPVEFEGRIVQVDAPSVDPNPDFISEGDKCWTALVTITNERPEPMEYSFMDFSVGDAEGFTYQCMGASSRPTLGSGTIAPGQTVKGYLAADLPATATAASVTFDTWLPTEEDWFSVWR
jgi:hypothetical protein